MPKPEEVFEKLVRTCDLMFVPAECALCGMIQDAGNFSHTLNGRYVCEECYNVFLELERIFLCFYNAEVMGLYRHAKRKLAAEEQESPADVDVLKYAKEKW